MRIDVDGESESSGMSLMSLGDPPSWKYFAVSLSMLSSRTLEQSANEASLKASSRSSAIRERMAGVMIGMMSSGTVIAILNAFLLRRRRRLVWLSVED